MINGKQQKQNQINRIIAMIICMVMSVCVAVYPALAGDITNAESLTFDNFCEAMGLATDYGVVAGTYRQQGHAETTVMADLIDKVDFQQTPYAELNRVQGASTAYKLNVNLTLPEGSYGDMTFALCTLNAETGIYEKYTGIEPVTVNTDGQTSVSFSFNVTEKEAMKKTFSVMQIEGDQIVEDGSINGAKLYVEYGPSVANAAKGDLYIGSLLTGDNSDPVKIINNAGGGFSHLWSGCKTIL